MPRRCVLSLLLLLLSPAAHAIIVRGKVTDTLGRPLPGSRVQLISLSGGTRSAADTIAGIDGAYELRTGLAGRFLLLTSPSINSHIVSPQVGYPFYGGRTDVLTMNVALDTSSVTPQNSAQPTLFETPLDELSSKPAQTAADQLLTAATILPPLETAPSAFLVQLGQTGAPAQLYLRGAPVDKTVVDGISAEQLGGAFNLATMTASGLSAIASAPAIELASEANPLYGADAQGGVLSFASPIANTMHPVLTYVGDAGNLSTVRNEGIFSVAHTRADALVSFARFNTDNDVPAARIHLVSSAANLGYYISGNTSLRVTLRDDVSAAPLPSPFAFYQLAPATRLASQNLYGSATFETNTARNWHNLVRYGLVRERAEAFNYDTPAIGLPVTIEGANGYRAAGTAAFLPIPARQDAVTNRDEYTYETDYPFTHYLRALVTARYQDERGANLTAAQSERLERDHFSVAAALQLEIRHRVYADASGIIDHTSSLGLHGAPRLGLTYAAVRPGTRKFHGTTLHFTGATGFSEPGVLESMQIVRPAFARSRTYDYSVDQTILPRRLDLLATYFHDQFAHQVETPNLTPLTLANALAYRAQGFESELRYHPATRVTISGGYTYLAALVQQSAATAAFNPNLLGIAIGATTALTGSRPFHRPPNTAFVTAEFTGRALNASFGAKFAGHSDDSTNLVLNPMLLLPNRNLSPGYASLDANVSFNVTHAIAVFTQLNNLADERHIAPIGYLSTPFAVRAGLRIRLGHE